MQRLCYFSVVSMYPKHSLWLRGLFESCSRPGIINKQRCCAVLLVELIGVTWELHIRGHRTTSLSVRFRRMLLWSDLSYTMDTSEKVINDLVKARVFSHEHWRAHVFFLLLHDRYQRCHSSCLLKSGCTINKPLKHETDNEEQWIITGICFSRRKCLQCWPLITFRSKSMI